MFVRREFLINCGSIFMVFILNSLWDNSNISLIQLLIWPPWHHNRKCGVLAPIACLQMALMIPYIPGKSKHLPGLLNFSQWQCSICSAPQGPHWRQGGERWGMTQYILFCYKIEAELLLLTEAHLHQGWEDGTVEYQLVPSHINLFLHWCQIGEQVQFYIVCYWQRWCGRGKVEW